MCPVFSFALMFASLVGLPGLNGFVGEFLILLGAFQSPILNSGGLGFAASGVIFAAVYLLWMYKRVVFGEVTNPKLNGLKDTEMQRNICSFLFLFLLCGIGIYPSTFLKVREP